MSDLTWTNDTRRLGDLIPWPRNPRRIGEAEAERLRRSWERFGQPEVIAIGPDNALYNGHQRLKVWSAAWGPDFEVAVRVSSRPLTEAEREELTATLHRGAMGEWDFEALKDWDTEKLLEWGFDEVELGITPSSDEWADAFGSVPDGDRAPFQQMTFTLHDTQVEQVKRALGVSKNLGEFVDSPNENSNGNALARVCETFLMDYGQGEGNRTQAD